MKKLILKISEYKLVFLSVALLVIFSFGCAKKDEKEIKIGAILPLSGTYASYGRYMQQGMELSLEDAIKNNIIKKNIVKLVFEDSQADPRKSVDAFYKLIKIDNVVAVVPATSAVILALKPLANKNEVVLINATAISPEIEDSPDYLFTIIPDASFEGKFLAEVSYEKLGKRNAAIIYRNDQSGKSFQDFFSKRFRECGGNVVFNEANEPNSNDFKAHITKIKTINSVDVVFVACFGTETAYYLKQAAELGLKVQVITYETFNSPKNIEIAGDAANNIIFCSPEFDKNSDDPAIRGLRLKVREKYNQNEFNFFIAAHYDAISLILDAISNGYESGKDIKQYLKNKTEYNGVTGKISFNENGGAIVPLIMYTVKDRKFGLFK